MQLDTLYHTLISELRDLYNAERQLVAALPRLAESATSTNLKEALLAHHKQTQAHVDRLAQVFEMLKQSPEGETCQAMQGLLRECGEVLNTEGSPPVKDAALIGAAQRIKHYEIAGYGTARQFADDIGAKREAQLLQQTLDEECVADRELTEISKPINAAAAQAAVA